MQNIKDMKKAYAAFNSLTPEQQNLAQGAARGAADAHAAANAPGADGGGSAGAPAAPEAAPPPARPAAPANFGDTRVSMKGGLLNKVGSFMETRANQAEMAVNRGVAGVMAPSSSGNTGAGSSYKYEDKVAEKPPTYEELQRKHARLKQVPCAHCLKRYPPENPTDG
jgi:hypothetical protein